MVVGSILGHSTIGRLILGSVTVFGRAYHLDNHPGQLSLLPFVGREMSIGKVRWSAASGSKIRMAHSIRGLWVAGKTVWSLVNTRHLRAL